MEKIEFKDLNTKIVTDENILIIFGAE